jgi:hypothetical protein
MNHLKRGKALRERLSLTYLVLEVSQTSLQSYTSDASKNQWKPADGAIGRCLLVALIRTGVWFSFSPSSNTLFLTCHVDILGPSKQELATCRSV